MGKQLEFNFKKEEVTYAAALDAFVQAMDEVVKTLNESYGKEASNAKA